MVTSKQLIAETASNGVSTMRAIVYYKYGSPDVAKLEEIDKPTVGDDEVLVSVRAASVNPYDWHFVTGKPYLMRMIAGLRKPKEKRLGVDFAGIVAAVGKNRTDLKPGDEVFGGGDGAFSEFAVARKSVVKKPANVTFEEAAAVPMAALTALQGLRDKGQIRADQEVLIVGAGGGVGTFAVQIAKSFGARVTGVCSTSKVELVRSLGADHVIDYTKEDFTRNGQSYDLILDTVGDRSYQDRKRALSPNGVLVEIGMVLDDVGVAFATRTIAMKLATRGGTKKMMSMLAEGKAADFATIAQLLETGKIRSVIGRTYPLSETPRAIAHVMEGHAEGKTVITI